MALAQFLVLLERPFITPSTAWLAKFLERHYVIFNFISNPLIDLGILFALRFAIYFSIRRCPGSISLLRCRGMFISSPFTARSCSSFSKK